MTVATIGPEPPDEPDRQPADEASERAMLAAVLYVAQTDTGAAHGLVDDLAALVEPADMWAGPHGHVWQALIEATALGEPMDPASISARLTASSAPARQAAAILPQLVTLATPPGSAAHHARKIARCATRRRLIRAGTQLVSRAYSDGFDPDTDVPAVLTHIEQAAGHTGGTGPVPVAAVVERAVDLIEHPEHIDVIPSGLHDLDMLYPGLRPGQLVVVGSRPSVGKALALDTEIPTPAGWATMGDLRVGDQVIGPDGAPTTVTAATDVMRGRPCYEVEFSDGTVIVADAEHQWRTSTRAARRSATPPRGYVFQRDSKFSRDQRHLQAFPAVVTTEHIARTLRDETGRLNHTVELAGPLDLPDAALPIDPYVLGVWLGDGASRGPQITTADDEIVQQIRAAGYPCRKLAATYQWSLSPGRGRAQGDLLTVMRKYDLIRNKHVPVPYQRASVAQRRALLAGLMDTDGWVSKGGALQFAVTSRCLAYDARDLIAGLGYRVSVATKRVRGRTEASSTCYLVNFTTSDPVFRLTRKLAGQQAQTSKRAQHRTIVDVRPVPSVPVRCIQVDHPTHLFLATRSCIPTHNSVFGLTLAEQAAIRLHQPTLLFSAEMTRLEVTQRLIANRASVDLGRILAGTCDDTEWHKIARHLPDIRDAPLLIDDASDVTVAHIRSAVRRQARRGLRLVVIDYLQLITIARAESRQSGVDDLARQLKVLAGECEVPIVLLSQLNRGPEQRHDKRPMLSDLRESGGIENHADVAVLIHRPDFYDPQDRPGECDLIVAKHRNGRTGTASVAFQGHYARMSSMTAWAER